MDDSGFFCLYFFQSKHTRRTQEYRAEWQSIKRIYIMSNSSLAKIKILSPNNSGKRDHKIDTITIHCMAGNLTVEACGRLFANKAVMASSNYGIGSDGRIALYVDEADRSWASSSPPNDHRAVTIEVANDGGENTGWHVSKQAYHSLIALVTDICKRNGIKRLLWEADRSLIGQIDKQNMTVHRWFKAKACPGDFLYKRMGKIADSVNKRLEKNKVSAEIDDEEIEITSLAEEDVLSVITDNVDIADLKEGLFEDSESAE